MPVTIGTLTSRVSVDDGGKAQGMGRDEIERLVKLVAARLKEMKKDGGDDGEIPERMSDSK